MLHNCIMKKILIILICSVSISTSFSQVEIIKDERIDGLVSAQSQIIPPSTVPQIVGYRLQLAFDSNKSVIDEARSRFASQFPKVDSYVEFTAPHFFLKVGDFRTQLEAEKVKAETAQQFPTGFVVKQLINLPRIDQ